jgi:hypothetical protein
MKKIPKILRVLIWVAILATFSFLVSFISRQLGAYNPKVWGFFTFVGIVGSFIFSTFSRKVWQFITRKNKHEGKNTLFKKLWKQKFKNDTD